MDRKLKPDEENQRKEREERSKTRNETEKQQLLLCNLLNICSFFHKHFIEETGSEPKHHVTLLSVTSRARGAFTDTNSCCGQM